MNPDLRFPYCFKRACTKSEATTKRDNKASATPNEMKLY